MCEIRAQKWEDKYFAPSRYGKDFGGIGGVGCGGIAANLGSATEKIG
jgi:hypothetical protein